MISLGLVAISKKSILIAINASLFKTKFYI